jgi:hypothetical protein
MKRVELAKDYSEFLIRCKMALISIERECNKRNFDVAKFMAHELGINAHLMRDAIERETLKQRS